MTALDVLIAANTHEDGDCLVWTGASSSGKRGGPKHPAARIDGEWRLVRRVLHERTDGPIPAGKVLRVTCGNTMCLNRDHWTVTTFQRIAKECAAKGVMSGHLRSAKIAATKRAGRQARITQDDARAIRSSSEAGAVLAVRYGISESTVSKIRRGQVRREFGSPWAGLSV